MITIAKALHEDVKAHENHRFVEMPAPNSPTSLRGVSSGCGLEPQGRVDSGGSRQCVLRVCQVGRSGQSRRRLRHAAGQLRNSAESLPVARSAQSSAFATSSSPQAHTAREEITVERLDEFDHEQGEFARLALIEDRRATPADTAAARIDVAAWLRSLSNRSRRIATTLAMGESTGGVARQFNLSSARVSQLREELKTSWESFHDRGQHQAGGACPCGQVAVNGWPK